MPTPKADETKNDFLSRCMGFPEMQKYDSDQRYAICQAKWDESKMSQQFAGKVSFDYDGVLSTDKGKELAKSINATLYIISARHDKQSMLGTAKDLGIPESRVYATDSNKAKVEKIKELGITRHYDNNPDVIKELGNVGKLF